MNKGENMETKFVLTIFTHRVQEAIAECLKKQSNANASSGNKGSIILNNYFYRTLFVLDIFC